MFFLSTLRMISFASFSVRGLSLENHAGCFPFIERCVFKRWFPCDVFTVNLKQIKEGEKRNKTKISKNYRRRIHFITSSQWKDVLTITTSFLRSFSLSTSFCCSLALATTCRVCVTVARRSFHFSWASLFEFLLNATAGVSKILPRRTPPPRPPAPSATDAGCTRFIVVVVTVKVVVFGGEKGFFSNGCLLSLYGWFVTGSRGMVMLGFGEGGLWMSQNTLVLNFFQAQNIFSKVFSQNGMNMTGSWYLKRILPCLQAYQTSFNTCDSPRAGGGAR